MLDPFTAWSCSILFVCFVGSFSKDVFSILGGSFSGVDPFWIIARFCFGSLIAFSSTFWKKILFVCLFDLALFGSFLGLDLSKGVCWIFSQDLDLSFPGCFVGSFPKMFVQSFNVFSFLSGRESSQVICSILLNMWWIFLWMWILIQDVCWPFLDQFYPFLGSLYLLDPKGMIAGHFCMFVLLSWVFVPRFLLDPSQNGVCSIFQWMWIFSGCLIDLFTGCRCCSILFLDLLEIFDRSFSSTWILSGRRSFLFDPCFIWILSGIGSFQWCLLVPWRCSHLSKVFVGSFLDVCSIFPKMFVILCWFLSWMFVRSFPRM